MTEIEKIDKEIAKKKKQLQNVHGSETEVYTRIVGYYRSVRGWNTGKSAERKERVNFNLMPKNFNDSGKKCLTSAPKCAKFNIDTAGYREDAPRFTRCGTG